MLLLAALACPRSAVVEGPQPRCTAGTSWSAGVSAFEERTKEWGLADIGADGVRVSAVDFDGDGWTDLAVRKGTTPDEWTTGVRQQWLLRNTGKGTFEDVTETSGVVVRRDGDSTKSRPGPVWAFADVDGDGDLDVFTGNPDPGSTETETSDVALNDGDGTFSLATRKGDLRDDPEDNPFGVAFADVDRDGHVDLWSGQYPASNYRQSQLFAGDGTGRFDDVTTRSGLDTEPWVSEDDINAGRAHAVTWSAAACDLTDDGAPELLLSSYGRAPNLLFVNDGTGVFTNQSVASGYAFDERVDWSDNESARCWCQLHPTDEDCEGVPPPTAIVCDSDEDAFRWDHAVDREPYRLGGNSGATMCGDVDNDGAVDLLTTEIVHWDVGKSSDPSDLLFNNGHAVFERPGNEVTGLTRDHTLADWNDGDITGSLFDFDNDGWLDVLVGSTDYEGTRALLWRQDAPRHFVAVPKSDGINHTRSHGSAVADFDRDGDLDVVLGHSSARCADDCYANFHVRLYENVLGQAGNFVQLRLVGKHGSNGAAIGARLWVTAGGATQIRDVSGGHGQWGAQDDLVQHVGLGTACEAVVRVRWPDAEGSEQTATLGAGLRWTWTQGQAPVAEAMP
jgi:hypothetical protein